MARSTWLLLAATSMAFMAPDGAQAQYIYSFPDVGVDTFDYDYPDMNDEGDRVIGVRSTPDIPSVNELSIDIGLDLSDLDCTPAFLLVFFDDIYLGAAQIGPLYDDNLRIQDTIVFSSNEVVDTRDHEIQVVLDRDLSFCSDDVRLDVNTSTISMDLVGADNDGDGSYSPTWYGDDCNESDATIYPGAPELCDGKDNDCDGTADEGVKNVYYQDADFDTWGNEDAIQLACNTPPGYVGRAGDCDDDNGSISPSASERCDGIDNDCDTSIDEEVTTTYYGDDDDDSYGEASDSVVACAAPGGYVPRAGDCDDNDDTTYPNAPELCDGVDNNCNGVSDEGVRDTYYLDGDGDGYGTSTSQSACEQPDGYAELTGDCNDADVTIYPNAPELCDGKDNNCNGTRDEGVQTTYYIDNDDDGFGVSSSSTQACSEPDGYTASPGDCDDSDVTTYPNAPELCDGADNNCNGSADEGVLNTYYEDDDGDSFGTDVALQGCSRPGGYASATGDCDDSDDSVYPNAPEVCDEKDNNCNGTTDEGATETFYQDSDGDGVGLFAETTRACEAPTGYAEVFGDCDDSDNTVFPDAPELCDEQDNDCDESVDEGIQNISYRDVDGDGFGDDGDTVDECQPPTGYVGRGGDCDDSDESVYPAAPELCDEQDNDCDSTTDEGVETTYYGDSDGDGFGDPDNTTQACAAPDGFVTRAGDCDDSDVTSNPDGEEVCDGADNNCDGTSDEGVTTTYFGDADDDGYGVGSTTIAACELPEGYAEVAGDCNDSQDITFPGADEVCDEGDNDCDGTADEGVQTTFYQDNDGDGVGVEGVTTLACEVPEGYSADAGDCNDSSDVSFPGADEICDEGDNDCDGSTDEGVQNTYYGDVDGDGFGVEGVTLSACARPNGYADAAGDCDDDIDTINPGAAEVCDEVDQDCDGSADEGVQTAFYGDLDEDGFGDPDSVVLACSAPEGTVEGGSDCDDGDAAVFPGAEEICNEIDDNCSGDTDEGVQDTFFRDADGDGYGSPGVTILACEAPLGYVEDDSDCLDSDANVYPGAEEICDLLDNDCDLGVDEGVLTTFYADTDNDTFGSEDRTQEACSRPNGYSPSAGDCDDTRDDVNPEADEVCAEDGSEAVDNDCDGLVDEGVMSVFYLDSDEDGYGDAGESMDSCEAPEGYVATGDDCIDSDPGVYPGAEEICGDEIDQDCNGQDLICGEADQDGDGFTPSGGDCDDDNGEIYPGAVELCGDGIDNDCSGVADDADADDDGFVDVACGGDDCDDGDDAISPSAEEICEDGIDNDCSGLAEDRDDDGDGFIDALCGGDDCDDGDSRLNPDAEEICDALDNNCSGVVDDRDVDGDTFFDVQCGGDDCNDLDEFINPDAIEVEDGIDNNCDGRRDEGSPSFDDDGDGVTEDGGDCDDEDDTVYPGAIELEDGKDNDCDGEIDEVDATPTPTPSPTPETPTPGEETPTPDLTPTPDVTPTDATPTDATPTDATPTDGTPTDGTGTPTEPDVTGSPTPTGSDPIPTATPTDGVTATPIGGGGDDCECSSGSQSGAGALSHLVLWMLGAIAYGRTRRRD